MAPDLLFYPVFNEAEALTGVSNREIIHPSTRNCSRLIFDRGFGEVV
jgi:hypothetical protein